jgi:hypothetical protein
MIRPASTARQSTLKRFLTGGREFAVGGRLRATVSGRPTADGGHAEMLTAERPFAACGKLALDV